MEALAVEHVEVPVWHGIGVLHAGHFAHAGAAAFQDFQAIVHDDQAFAGVVAWSPQEVALMSADRRRKTVLWSKEVDGASLAVILPEDCSLRSNLRRQAAVDAGYSRR